MRPVAQAHILLLIVALAAIGYWADFIPTNAWSLTSKIFTLCASIPVVWFLWRRTYRDTSKPFSNRLLQYLGAPLVCYVLILPATLSGLPYLATYVLGTDDSRLKTLVKMPPSRKGCKSRMGGPLLKPAFSRYICVKPEEFAKFPSRGFYTLDVRDWRLGYIIRRIEYRSVIHGTYDGQQPAQNPNRIFK